MKPKFKKPTAEEAQQFVLLLSQGKSKVEAYRETFPSRANRPFVHQEAYRFEKTKIVSDATERLATELWTYFATDRYKALKELLYIGRHADSEKLQLEAMKTFLALTAPPFIKPA